MKNVEEMKALKMEEMAQVAGGGINYWMPKAGADNQGKWPYNKAGTEGYRRNPIWWGE